MVDKVAYNDHRSQIRSGDLLIWSHDRFSTISDIFLTLVRFFTKSSYGHVGIAWKIGDRLFVIEATIPQIRIAPVSLKDEFYHIPMNIRWKKEYENFLLDKIGLSYSFMDDLRAYFGITLERDDKWQCAELCNVFYKSLGLDFGSAYTPAELIDRILDTEKSAIYKVQSL